MSIKTAVAGVLAMLVAAWAVAGITVISPGEVALQVKMLGAGRGIQEEVLRTGTRWVEPIIYNIANYNYQLKQYPNDGNSFTMEAQTADGQPVTVEVSLEVGLQPDRIPWLHENIGRDWFERVTYPALRQILRNSVPTQLSDQIYTGVGRTKVQELMQERLQSTMKERGIDVVVNLRDIKFQNKGFVATLEEKATAAQKEIIEERLAAAAAQTAIKTENIARGEKLRRIQAAEADREERRLAGEGERLKREEEAKGTYAILHAEAEGIKEKTKALLGPGGQVYAQIVLAEQLANKVHFVGFPTGSPGTFNVMNLGDTLKTFLEGAGTPQNR